MSSDYTGLAAKLLHDALEHAPKGATIDQVKPEQLPSDYWRERYLSLIGELNRELTRHERLESMAANRKARRPGKHRASG